MIKIFKYTHINKMINNKILISNYKIYKMLDIKIIILK